MTSILDTGSLTKPRDFNGDEKDWPAWEFALMSYLNLSAPHMADVVESANAQDRVIVLEEMNDEQRHMAHQLFHLLVMLCQKGKPVPLLMACERGNGFAAFREIKLEMEPKIGGDVQLCWQLALRRHGIPMISRNSDQRSCAEN